MFVNKWRKVIYNSFIYCLIYFTSKQLSTTINSHVRCFIVGERRRRRGGAIAFSARTKVNFPLPKLQKLIILLVYGWKVYGSNYVGSLKSETYVT